MIATRVRYEKTCGADTFSILYQEHAEAANLLALRLTGNPVLAEDAVQEAMLRIWRGLPTLRPGNTRSWVFRIVARECYRLLASTRQDGNRRRSANSIRNTSIPHGPLERMEQEILVSAIDKMIPMLPDIERELLALHFMGGLSQRKIGAAMDIPQQTVSRHLKNALDHLRDKLMLHH